MLQGCAYTRLSYRTRAPRGTRAQFEVLLRNTSHNNTPEGSAPALRLIWGGHRAPHTPPLAFHAKEICSFRAFNRAGFIKPARVPWILMVIASFILGLLTQPHHSCATGALQGPLYHKRISLCSARGSRAFGPSPLHPPFTSGYIIAWGPSGAYE